MEHLLEILNKYWNDINYHFDVSLFRNFRLDDSKIITNLIKKRLNLLKKSLTQWEYEYYGLERPSVSDYQYDVTLKELNAWETLFISLKTLNSPTNRVGGAASNRFNKVAHKLPMLSLSNVFNYEELKHFDETINKVTGDIDNQYIVEPKFDGLSMSLIYSKGKLTQGLTRGDGKIGEDVTNNIRVINNIPQTINNDLERFEVRGEIFIDFDTFKKINDSIADEKKKFANPRNAASGTLRRLNSDLVKERNLKFVAYYIPDYSNLKALNISKQSDVITSLKQLGFFTSSDTYLVENIVEAYKKIELLEKNQDKISYPIDGAVVKLNNIYLYDELGKTSKFPHWATAYKFAPKLAQTKIKNIYATVGRTGKITYVANLEPVSLSGTTTSNATLNNAEYITNKDIRINDTVEIFKAAEIIPYVSKVVIEKRPSNTEPFKPITNCPICHSLLEKYEDEVDQYCININCPSRIVNSIIFFCSKMAMDIAGLSEKTIEKLYQNGYIKSLVDIYKLNLHREAIVKNIYNDKYLVFNKIINAIEASKNNSLEKLLVGLGIHNVGSVTALELAKHFNTIDALMNASITELKQINHIGDENARSIYDYFQNEGNHQLINDLKTLGVNINYINKTNVSLEDKASPYYQKTFCITGSFDIPRHEIANILIHKYDAKVVNSVTKSLNYLIVGANGGSKKDKALKLNIPLIEEKIW